MSKFDFKSYVRDMLLQEREAAAQAGPDDLLGKYAWPNIRRTAERGRGNPEENLPAEENTPYENELEDAFIKHLGGENIPLEPKHTNNIKDFLNRGVYKKIFKPYNTGFIYRGITASTDRLKQLLGLGVEDKIPKFAGRMTKKFEWAPRLGKKYGSSWTVKEEVAWDFASKYMDDERRWLIVVKANAGENRGNLVQVFPNKSDPNTGLYRLFGGWDDEDEVIALGPVIVSEIIWKISSVADAPDFVDQVKQNIKSYRGLTLTFSTHNSRSWTKILQKLSLFSRSKTTGLFSLYSMMTTLCIP